MVSIRMSRRGAGGKTCPLVKPGVYYSLSHTLFSLSQKMYLKTSVASEQLSS